MNHKIAKTASTTESP